MADRYSSWSELAEHEVRGVDFDVHLDARNGVQWMVAAPHGGGIEPGTTEIARAIAEQKYSFYSVDGMKPKGNAVLHITSHRFDEPSFLKAADQHDGVAAIHGCDATERGSNVLIWVGGADDHLIDTAIKELQAAGYAASRDTFTPGREPKNVCNRGRSGCGLQLEISESFRRRLFRDLTRAGRQHPTPELNRFAVLVRGMVASRRTDKGRG